MALEITAIQNCTLNVVEKFDPDTAPALSESSQGASLTFDKYSKSKTLNKDSTPDVDIEPVDLSFTLSGTTKDWDLTAAPKASDSGETLDLTGKRVICMQLEAPAGNSASIAIAGQGANAYDELGSVTLHPGEAITRGNFGGVATTRAVVGASDKDVRITGTSGDKLNVLLVFGS